MPAMHLSDEAAHVVGLVQRAQARARVRCGFSRSGPAIDPRRPPGGDSLHHPPRPHLPGCALYPFYRLSLAVACPAIAGALATRRDLARGKSLWLGEPESASPQPIIRMQGGLRYFSGAQAGRATKVLGAERRSTRALIFH